MPSYFAVGLHKVFTSECVGFNVEWDVKPYTLTHVYGLVKMS